jgi:hypothetical protein
MSQTIAIPVTVRDTGLNGLVCPADLDNKVTVLNATLVSDTQLRASIQRYFLAQDGSCHWFLVPEDKRCEWEAWANLPEEEQQCAPEFAKWLEGDPSLVTFTDPIVD